jgi:hypothetical protein
MAGLSDCVGYFTKWRGAALAATAIPDILRDRGKVSSIMVRNAASIMACEAAPARND